MRTEIEEMGLQLWGAIIRKQPEVMRQIVAKYPALVTDYRPGADGAPDGTGRTWMNQAAGTRDHEDTVEVMATLLSLGFSPNALRLPERSSALGTAIGFDNYDLAKFLLEHGADPNLDRTLISAMNCDNPELAMRFTKLLLQHGVDVNQVFNPGTEVCFTALDWASGNPEIADYLRAHGAKHAAELGNQKTLLDLKASLESYGEAVIEYFTEHFGPVREKSLTEIVPSEPAITIHLVPSSANRKHLTLFTTGMSSAPMTVPRGEEQWQFAELFIELPAKWKLKELGDPNWGWPIQWLRSLGKYPHANNTWLGGAVTIIDNDDPLRPLAPNMKFTSLLLMAERKLSGPDGQMIQLYRLTPLYPEERDLERREGLPALLRAFDKHDVPFIVDLNRKNVATSKLR